MKKLIIIFIFCHNLIMAQDTLHFRTGENIAVKVNEIGITEIKYKRFDNLDGPQYVVEKNDIRYIKYSNGNKDSFALVKPAQVNAGPVNFEAFNASKDKIKIDGRKLFYKGNPVGEHRLLMMASALPEGDKKTKMQKTYEQMREHKKKQYLFGLVGFGLVGASFLMVVSQGNAGNTVPLAVGSLIGIGAAITGETISIIHKRKRTLKKLDMASIYNE